MPQQKRVTLEVKRKEGFTIEADAGKHKIIIDQPAPSGSDSGASPLHHMFAALGGCFITLGTIISRQKGIDLKNMSVKIEGEYDPAYLMGKTKEGRAGFTKIKIAADIDADISDAEKEALLKEIDERCPVSDNIMNKTPFEFELKK